MDLTVKLNDTYELLNNLENTIINGDSSSLLKKQLIIISNDLSNYKDSCERMIEQEQHEIKSKIELILARINDIEKNVRNKLLITEKYSSYLNS